MTRCVQTQVQSKACVEWEAFCLFCPTPEEVTCLLQRVGCVLTFSMPAIPSSYGTVPALPAQYHYRDMHGTEVIYLAGRDANTEGEHLPEHASRFWLTAGANHTAAVRTRSLFRQQWRLCWHEAPESVAPHEELA